MFVSIYNTIKGFIRVVIKGSPRLLALNSLIWIFFGLISGAVGLTNHGVTNVFTIILFGWAAVEIILALIRWNAWKKDGLRQTLPNGTTFMRVDHIADVQQRDNPILNMRTTTTTFYKQVIPLTPPASGIQHIPVPCATCQREMLFKVASREERRAIRTRAVVIALLCLLLGLGLSVASSSFFQMQPQPGWVPWVWFTSLILLFCGILASAYFLNYTGAVIVYSKSAHGHRVRQPEKADYVQFRQMISSASIEPMMPRPSPSQQG